jgi:quercetin dioxygenase-like cupin family protein
MPAIALIKSQSPAIETLKMGPIKIRILEDGSKTDNRIGAVSLSIAPRTAGPGLHWHRMHDETFLITKGTIRFSTVQEDHDAGVGDYVVVPPKAVHAFSNPFDEEAEFFNTFTPAYYVDYLRMLAQQAREGKGPLTVEQQVEAMKQFATFLPGREVEA